MILKFMEELNTIKYRCGSKFIYDLLTFYKRPRVNNNKSYTVHNS